jgi:hypothetical protein
MEKSQLLWSGLHFTNASNKSKANPMKISLKTVFQIYAYVSTRFFYQAVCNQFIKGPI